MIDGISSTKHGYLKKASTEVNASIERKESEHEGHPRDPRDAMIEYWVGVKWRGHPIK